MLKKNTIEEIKKYIELMYSCDKRDLARNIESTINVIEPLLDDECLSKSDLTMTAAEGMVVICTKKIKGGRTVVYEITEHDSSWDML